MTEATARDWEVIDNEYQEYARSLPDRVISHLRLLDGEFGGFGVDRLQHSLQAATRACEAGRDEEYVVCALLHDIGDLLACHNHQDIAAAILKPFVSERNHWIVSHHAIFQKYYFNHFYGKDRNLRDAFRASPHFDATEEFCRLYDQVSFDPDYTSMDLGEFEPMLRRVLCNPS